MAFAPAWGVAPVLAASIDCQLQPLGGGDYQCNYTVANNGSLGSTAVKEFDLLFDPTLYDESSLKITTPGPLASNWSELLLASAPGVPAAFDALALGSGIPNGTSVSGFAVDFRYLGKGTPGSQGFEVYDPSTFVLLESGETNGGGTSGGTGGGGGGGTGGGTGVPTPPSLWLLPLGLSGVLVMRRRSGRRPARTGAP